MKLLTTMTLALASLFSAHILPTADALVARDNLGNGWCIINLRFRELEYLNTTTPRRSQIFDVGFIGDNINESSDVN
jgi:hypothetical protein